LHTDEPRGINRPALKALQSGEECPVPKGFPAHPPTHAHTLVVTAHFRLIVLVDLYTFGTTPILVNQA